MRIKADAFPYYKSSSFLIISMLFFLAVTGIISPYKYNLLPVNPILEIVLIIAALLAAKGTSGKYYAFITISSIYLLSSFLIMHLLKPANIFDFAQAYKSFYYIIPLSLFAGKDKFNEKQIKTILYFLLAMFLAKYSYSRLLHLDERLSTRPGLYVENNFELILLIIIYYLATPTIKKYKLLTFATLAFIVVISGSRSALLALLIVYSATFIKKIDAKFILSITALAILLWILYMVFSERLAGGNLEEIDRYRFMMVFINEIRNWGVFNYLFGSIPLTPLSPQSCASLSFYEGMFSSAGTGECYSVILHAYLLRVIFDQGIIALLLMLAFIWTGLGSANYTNRQKYCIIGVLMISGVSVSSVNSIFSAIALAIAFSYKQTPKTVKKHHSPEAKQIVNH